MVLVAGEASGLQQSRAMEDEGVITRAIDQLRGGHPGEVGATCKRQEAWLRMGRRRSEREHWGGHEPIK